MTYFLLCEICGNIVGPFKDVGVKMECCRQEMSRITADMVDAAREKHLPAAKLAINRSQRKESPIPAHDCRTPPNIDCHRRSANDTSNYY